MELVDSGLSSERRLRLLRLRTSGAVPAADIGLAVNIVVKAAVFAADIGLGVDVVKVVVAGCATEADVGCVEATG